MLKAPSEFIVVFIIVSVMLILGMAIFISLIIYRYQQKQNIYFKDIETLKTSHENTLLQSQLEIQEQTFQNISREIHDNIGQKLTLAKLYLNTLEFADKHKASMQVNDAVHIIGETISELKDLSRSMSSEIILNNGFIKALEFEAAQLAKSGIYKINFSCISHPVFMDIDTGLVLFRISQEVLNNIVKHAHAAVININFQYSSNWIILQIKDDGKGFDTAETFSGNGLQNIKKRTAMLKGNLIINSNINIGTEIKIKIPLHENDNTL